MIFTGCGSSLYLAQSAAAVFTKYTGVSTKAVACSEIYFYPELYIGKEATLVVPFTRKSTTTEVQMAIKKARSFANVKSLSITCDGGSAEYNDYMILSANAAEDSVVMTRSYTSMLYIATAMAMYLGGAKDDLELLKTVPDFSEKLIGQMDKIAEEIIKNHDNLNLYISLGQGGYYGVVNECMNKMKEMGIVNSEAYHSLEYRHGPMSIADKDTLVLLLANEETLEMEVSLLEQMKSYGCVTALVGKNIPEFEVDYKLELDAAIPDSVYMPVVGVIGQLLGLYIAQKKGINPDSPQNLTQAIIL